MTVPVSVSEVKKRLVGLDGWLAAAAASAASYDDLAITAVIPTVIREYESDVQFRILPVQVVSNPDGTYATADSAASNGLDVTGTYEVLEESPYPFYAERSAQYLYVRLRNRPVRQVQRVRLMLDNLATQFTLPPSWIRVDKQSGSFTIMPVSGAASIAGVATAFQLLSVSFGWTDYVPSLIAIDYIAGLPDNWATNYEWGHLFRSLTEACALRVLEDISELFDAGLMTKTISDMGATQSLNYSRFKDRKLELSNRVSAAQDRFRSQNGSSILISGI